MNVFLLFLALGAVVLGWYLISVRRYPRVPCRWCKGKVPRDPVYRKAFGKCGHCGGKGWKDRWGTRMTGKGK